MLNGIAFLICVEPLITLVALGIKSVTVSFSFSGANHHLLFTMLISSPLLLSLLF
jgi:hypothetical protein